MFSMQLDRSIGIIQIERLTTPAGLNAQIFIDFELDFRCFVECSDNSIHALDIKMIFVHIIAFLNSILSC